MQVHKLQQTRMFRNVIMGFGAFGVLCVIELLLRYLMVPMYIIPLPSQVAVELFSRPVFYGWNLSITAFESLAGFVLGNGVAYAAALFLVLLPRYEQLGVTAAVFVKATPIVALAPLFVIWFGNGIFGKCLMAGLVCFFPMFVNAISGLKSVDVEIVDYMRSIGASRIQIITKVRIPFSLPYVFAAAKMSSTISIVGAIVAELSGSDEGIGYIMLVSIYQLETVRMFTAIFCVGLFGLVFYALIAKAQMIFSFSNQEKTL